MQTKKCKCGEKRMTKIATGEFDGAVFHCPRCGMLFVQNPERNLWYRHNRMPPRVKIEEGEINGSV